MVRRINIEPNDLLEFGGKLRIVGELELAHQMRPKALGTPYPLHRTDADPGCFRHGRTGPMARCGGGPASVIATTRSVTSGLSGGMRDGRVLSRQSPAAPRAGTAPANARSPSWPCRSSA